MNTAFNNYIYNMKTKIKKYYSQNKLTKLELTFKWHNNIDLILLTSIYCI